MLGCQIMDFGLRRSFGLERETKAVLGLDIGSSVVKLIRLRKDGADYTVTAAGIAAIAPGEDDANQRKLNVIRAVRQCLDFTGVKGTRVVCGLCGPEVAVRDFKFPSLPAEEVEGAVLLEASQVCPFKTEDSTVDYQLVSDGNGDISGVLVAATNAMIKRKVKIAHEASLNCVLMDVDGLALLNCFNEYEKPEAGRTTAILNVGGSYTTLAIIGDNERPFIRDMIYAGDDIVNQIAAENNMPAEETKAVMLGDSTSGELELGDSLRKSCRKLIVDVTKTSRYYMTQEKTDAVEKILVCGGFALAKGFVEILDSQLPAEVVLWNPFEKVRCRTGRNHRGILQKNVLQKNGPAMAVAAGLAMRSI